MKKPQTPNQTKQTPHTQILFAVLGSAFASMSPKQSFSSISWSTLRLLVSLLVFSQSLLGKAVVLPAAVRGMELRALAILRLSAIQITKAP